MSVYVFTVMKIRYPSLACDTASLGIWFLTFQHSSLVSSLRVKRSKTMGPLCHIKMSKTKYLPTQYHIPEELIPLFQSPYYVISGILIQQRQFGRKWRSLEKWKEWRVSESWWRRLLLLHPQANMTMNWSAVPPCLWRLGLHYYLLEVFVQWKGVLADSKIVSVYQQIKKLVHDIKHINQTHQRKKIRIKRINPF